MEFEDNSIWTWKHNYILSIEVLDLAHQDFSILQSQVHKLISDYKPVEIPEDNW